MDNNDNNIGKFTREVNSVLPPVSVSPEGAINVQDLSVRATIIKFLVEKEEDPQFYIKRANTLLTELKTCLSTFSKETQDEYKARMKRWGASNVIPYVDIKEKLLSYQRSTQEVNINKPYCAKCANKGKVKISYNMVGLNNEKVILSQVKIQLIPYQSKALTQYFSATNAIPYIVDEDIPLSEAEKQEYIITLDENGEAELDWSDEKFAKYSRYHVVVLPVEKGDVDNWLQAYQMIIDELHQQLQDNWTNEILPEWESYSTLEIAEQYQLLSQWWNVGLVTGVDDKLEKYKKALEKLEEWDFRGWIDELFKERVVSDEPTLTLLQDEVRFYLAAYYAQSWMAMLPPHYQMVFAGEMYSAIMISVMEFVAEFLVEALIFKGVTAGVSKSVSAINGGGRFINSMTKMSDGLKQSMKAIKPNRAILGGNGINVVKHIKSSSQYIKLSTRLKPWIQIGEKKIAKAKSSLSKSRNKKGTSRNPAQSGEPISMVTGEELLTLDDGEFKGLLPFIWQRCYRSSAVEHNIGLGYGWSHSLAHYLLFEGEEVVWLDDENLLTTFPLPTQKDPIIINPVAESSIYLSDTADEYILYKKGNNRVRYHFKRVEQTAYLSAITDKYGHRLNVVYDNHHRLIALQPQQDKTRRLAFGYYDKQSILIDTVTIQILVEGEWQTLHPLMHYHYNDHHQLIGATNAAGQTETYEYDALNVIQKRTMAGGAEFNWVWEGEGQDVRCLRQWGNFGL
ncbi:hypothetical protein A9G29_10790 [Gilliamella sp. Fer2-1]|nr:hypothetical protein A9G29_10790 [Gilliamella apicola]